MLKAIENTQFAFNYDIVPEPVAVQAREAAQRIKLRLRRSAEDIIEIGRDLLAVKDRIGHGNFLPWIEAEFGMGQATAYRFMQVAEAYGSKITTVINLDPTALYALAAPKTPLEVREEIEKMIEAGEVVTKATVAKLKAEGRTLDKDMVHLMTPKGARAYASLQFNQIGKMKLVHGANAIETVWKSLGDLIPVARKGVTNVYVAKNGATDMELAAMRDLRTGKLNARVLANEQLVEAIDEARSVLDGRNLGEMYAASCTEYFHTLPLEAAE